MKNLKDYIGKEITIYRIIDDVKNTPEYTIDIIDNYVIREKDIKRDYENSLSIKVKWTGYSYDLKCISKNEFEFISNIAWSEKTDIDNIKTIVNEIRENKIKELKENISKMKKRIKRLENPKYTRKIELD